MPENTNPEDDLFEAALLKSPGPERAAFLDDECQSDPELRARVEMMLEGHLSAQDFLENLPTGTPPERGIPSSESAGLEQVGGNIGPYKLLQKLGEGGCGLVYLAEQQQPVRRRVALKVIKLGMDTRSVIARFEAERQALALMDHPNIAKVFDAGVTETGRPYFVMELVRGIRISEYCDLNNLRTDQRLSIFVQVCHAIQHAHQKGIIHRDIKPSNILITLHDGVPVPKVIDFGIAKATCDQRLTDKTIFTAFEQFIGTPAYMSPEQAEMSGLDIDTRSDIYSLGVLLYELLTGSTPFDAKELLASGLDAMRKTIREKEAVRPSTKFATLQGDDLATTAKRRSAEPARLMHQLKGDLDWIIMKCLEKDRTRRYETANGLAADLQRHLSNEPVVARPPSTLYRFQKAWRRNKAMAVAGTGIFVALVIGLGVSTWMYLQERRAYERTALAEREQARLRSVEEGLRKNETGLRQRAQAGEQEAQRSAAALKRTAYVGDMAQVQQATAEGNLGRARSLLDRYRAKAGEDDIRGFEWRYLWAQARSDEAAKLGEYKGHLGGLAFSPDGIYLASAARRGIEIRSFQNRALLLTLSNAGGGPIQFSPDSQFLVRVRKSGLAHWNTRTWKERPELPGVRAPFVFAQHGELLVARQDDHISIWNTETAGKIADLPGTVSFSDYSKAIGISPDGNTVFLGDSAQIRSWDLRTQIELQPMSYPLGLLVAFLAVSPEGLLAAAHGNGHVTLWDLKTRQLLHTFESHLSWVSSVVFSPDGSLLASASADQNIFLYETRSRKLLRRFKGHEGEIWVLQFSPDGHWLVSGSEFDKSLRLWEVAGISRGREQVEMSVPLRFVDSNRSLICASWMKGFARIDLKTGTIQPLAEWPVPLEIPNAGARFLLNAGRVLSLSPDGTRAAAVLPDSGRLRIWNILSSEREIVLTNSSGSIESALFAEDGKRLAVAGKGSQTRLWNTTDGSSELLGDSISGQINRLAYSLDGTRLAQAGHDGGMVFDLASRKTIFRFRDGRVTGLALSQNGRFLAAGTELNLIHLWDVNSGQLLGILRGHVAEVEGLSFSPDGKTLASCGDNRVKLWNIETLQEILTLVRFSSAAGVALFSSDGSCLATSSHDDRVQLWRAPSFEEIAATEAKEKAEIKQP
jgi:WD40 repeat protein/serine/threonine protein kinase